MSSNNENRNPAPSYEITMREFLERLECIRDKLNMEIGVYIDEAKSTRVKSGMIKNILSFFSLGTAADNWEFERSDQVTEVVYQCLNDFLSNPFLTVRRDLEKRWVATFLFYQEQYRDEFGQQCKESVVKQCVEAVLSEFPDDQILKDYGTQKFEDGRIISILGMILLWLSALPCTKDAEDARNQYRENLKSKLKRLLAPEFSALIDDLIHYAASRENLKEAFQKEYQAMDDKNYESEHEKTSRKDKGNVK